MYTLSFATGIPGSHVIFFLWNVDAKRKGGPKEMLRKIENPPSGIAVGFLL